MAVTDVIALILAPLWAALKDKVPIAVGWHPWIIVGIAGGLLAGVTALGMNGTVGWSAELFWQAVTIVGSVFTGYTVAKPVESLGNPKVVAAAKVTAVLAVILLLAGSVVLAQDSLAVEPAPVSDGIAKTITIWFGILGGILARLIRRKIG